MANWKTLTRASDNAAIYVQLAQIAKVEPAGTGSVLTLIGVNNEGHSATVAVTQSPTQVLTNPETIVA
ncbi:hypothetical protein AC628_25280 [Bradyrhizobium sp. NAS96.2]|nr:hypothetical protein AC628_25280 [Bradyrhizobium sp. NAS96.2]